MFAQDITVSHLVFMRELYNPKLPITCEHEKFSNITASNPYEFIEHFAQYEVIHSASLEGLILAATYGKPFVWLTSEDNLNRLKIVEFFASIGVDIVEDQMTYVQMCKIDKLAKSLSANKRKLFVSITSIYQKQEVLAKMLRSVLSQTRRPDKIYIYLSEEPYLLDTGFPNKILDNADLVRVLENDKIEVKWVPNTGPYRKLLPLLKEIWDTNHLIVTLDDDVEYKSTLLRSLCDDYAKHQCSVNYRGFRMQFDDISDIIYDISKVATGTAEVYNFSVGIAGTLFTPSFFKNTGNLIFDDKLYLKYMKTGDDNWYNIIRILNSTKLYATSQPQIETYYRLDDVALYFQHNREEHKNNDTVQMRALVKALQDKGYVFS